MVTASLSLFREQRMNKRRFLQMAALTSHLVDRFTVPLSTQPSSVNALPQFMADNFGLARHAGDPIQSDPMQWMGVERDLQAPLAFGSDGDVLWSWQPAPNAEFLDAAGGSLYQDYQDGFSML